MSTTLLLTALGTVLFLALRHVSTPTTKRIPGIPEIPGLPVFGSLIAIGSCYARKAQEWSKLYGPVFQVRLGNKRIVFANTYASVHELWIRQQSALISRPQLYTFHSVLSSSEGFTIGTSPWDASCKRRRKAAATALNRPAVASYMPILDLESRLAMRELVAAAEQGEVDPAECLQRFALNTSLTLCYGARVENVAMLKEIIEVERAVSNIRSTSNNWQDYVPLLRGWGGRSREAERWRKRRDVYMTVLLEGMKRRIEQGDQAPCIAGNVLRDPEAVLSDAELNSICLTMVSGGLDTVPGNLIMGLGYLSTSAGQAVQEKCYEAIMDAYPNGNAWEACLAEERVPYLTAFVKETLRFWTVLPLCLPRVSIKDMVYAGATIPAGTTFFMNAYAADYDSAHFDAPYEFRPERYLDTEAGSGTPHYAFGAGSRMCAGSHLANRELFTVFLRMLVAFRVHPAAREEDRPVMDALECNRHLTSLTTDPKEFKVRLEIRDRAAVESWLR